MTEPYCVDPASNAITTLITAMKAVFSPDADCPPIGGGSEDVYFYAGEGAPIDEVGCESPFLWVRLAARYRSEVFPDPSVTVSPCGALEVITVELGVARCVSMEPTKESDRREAVISLDDSWRLGKAMCTASATLSSNHQVGTDMINPYGPQGGVVAWSSNIYISV